LLQRKNTIYSSENGGEKKKSKELTGLRRMNWTIRILLKEELLEGLYAFICRVKQS